MYRTKNCVLYIFICLAVFFSGLSTGSSAQGNMVVILFYELLLITFCFLSLKVNSEMLSFLRRHLFVFCLASLLLLVLLIYYYFTIAQNIYIFLILFAVLTRDLSPYYERLRNNKLLTGLFALWLISVSISFFGSPFNVADSYISRVRFEQTIVHFVCFFCLTVFLQDKKPPTLYLLLTIPVSMLVVSFSFIYLYVIANGEIGPTQWFAHPPFNAHIRHVGYQVTAGLSILLALFVAGRHHGLSVRMKMLGFLHFIATALLWAFLFWCGGRSSIGSLLVLLILIGFLLWYDKARYRYFVLMGVASMAVGLLLSIWLSVFPWNGLFQSIERTVSAETVRQFSSSRNYLWLLAWEALNGNWLFGLGANAYIFIQDVPSKVAQPHGIFIQFLTEWGIVGSLLFISMLSIAFLRGMKIFLRAGISGLSVNMLAAGAVIVSLSVHGILDGTYFHAQPVFALITVFAVWLASSIHV